MGTRGYDIFVLTDGVRSCLDPSTNSFKGSQVLHALRTRTTITSKNDGIKACQEMLESGLIYPISERSGCTPLFRPTELYRFGSTRATRLSTVTPRSSGSLSLHSTSNQTKPTANDSFGSMGFRKKRLTAPMSRPTYIVMSTKQTKQQSMGSSELQEFRDLGVLGAKGGGSVASEGHKSLVRRLLKR
mmetsp:Transcript_7192/g.18757  ORF Transcript_7192/g.18757 Transcript_7192/m.18757 type:complete len:187 (+) Transcript_7192:82-642(+)